VLLMVRPNFASDLSLVHAIWSAGEFSNPSNKTIEGTSKEVTQMIDFHQQNIERRLLATELTDLERQYLHKRIAEEHAELERLEKRQAGRDVPADLSVRGRYPAFIRYKI
jgi:hypothetical protein